MYINSNGHKHTLKNVNKNLLTLITKLKRKEKTFTYLQESHVLINQLH